MPTARTSKAPTFSVVELLRAHRLVVVSAAVVARLPVSAIGRLVTLAQATLAQAQRESLQAAMLSGGEFAALTREVVAVAEVARGHFE